MLMLAQRAWRLPLSCALPLWLALSLPHLSLPLVAEERSQSFDRDPGWIGHNNRADDSGRRQVTQDFGFSATNHAGGSRGEIGGTICPAAEPSYYAKRIPPRTFNDELTASGSISCTGRPFHVLVGFFNSTSLNEWRTPNTIAMRLSGRGDVFYAWLEYATARWRAGGDSPQGFPTVTDPQTGRRQLKGLPVGQVLKWSLKYDPQGNRGTGSITASIGDQSAVCHLKESHRADGAVFDRCGIMTVMKSADSPGELWMDDICVNGELESFDADPGWDAFENRRTFESSNVRPHFDFGYSATHYAGGARIGELGGLIFRGDCRYPQKMAYYADRTSELSLEAPLRASGRIAMRRGVTDSTVLFGFFHSRESVRVNPSQDTGLPLSFLGISTDGPSREGFYFAPTYRTLDDGRGAVTDEHRPPHLYPDGKSRAWTLEYVPSPEENYIKVTLDDHTVRLKVAAEHRKSGTRFDRFGILTTWVDGNGQQVYLDDLVYTVDQHK